MNDTPQTDTRTPGELKREELLRDVHLAVCGNENVGVPGLVKDVRELKEWKRRVELRVAGISGAVSLIVIAAKWFFEKH